MIQPIVGRSPEIRVLREALKSPRPELVALYGRRRVGKTFLIREVYRDQIVLEITGLIKGTTKKHLQNFAFALSNAQAGSLPTAVPQDWLEAFQMLQLFLQDILRPGRKTKKVLFIDEFPWFAKPKSGFVPAFESFWNGWASKRNDLVVVICGSAASWMVKKLLHDHEGLYRRITRRIRMLPFNLSESEQLLKQYGIALDRYEILQLYMALGGIPFYFIEVQRGMSAAQNIDHILFSENAPLHGEFKMLYNSIFKKAERHISVVRALGASPKGLTRDEIMNKVGYKSGGTFTAILDDLEQSGFIKYFIPYGLNANEGLYRLIDEFSLFYFKFIAGKRISGSGAWIKKSTTQSWKSWSGLAFEAICLKHISQIKRALELQAIHSEDSTFYKRGAKSSKGVQIDLLIDRADRIINICEIKFSVKPYTINKSHAGVLREKIQTFQHYCPSNQLVFLTLITTFGVVDNMYKTSLVQSEVNMEALFAAG